MRISPLSTTSVAPAEKPEGRRAVSREVETTRTRATMPEMKAAIGRAYRSLTGRDASPPLLDTMTAQAGLETGRGEQMFNFNFGGIKGTSASGETFRSMTREVINGESVHLKDGFRSYRSLDDGARDFVSLLQGRYGSALERAAVGDVHGYARELHNKGYYTAPVSEYATGLSRIVGELGGSSAIANASGSAPSHGGHDLSSSTMFDLSTSMSSLPTTASLDRFIDAITAAPLARVASPLEDDEST